MTQHSQASGLSRRSLARGAAWAVPTIAVMGAAPIASASGIPTPPQPQFNAANGWKNPGNSCHNSPCTPKQSYAIQVVADNPDTVDWTLVFTSYSINNQSLGVSTVVADAACSPVSTGCTVAGCSGVTASNSVCVPAGKSGVTVYVISKSFGSSPSGTQTVGYQWVRNSDCMAGQMSSSGAQSAPPGSCS